MLFHATESQAAIIFMIAWIPLGLAAMVAESARTGFVAYSMRSMIKTRDWKPTWEVDKSRLSQYLKIVGLTLGLTVLFTLTFDTRLEDVAIAALMNTIVVAWGCYYWVLCKDKPEPNTKSST